jgi:hypothetical protein
MLCLPRWLAARSAAPRSAPETAVGLLAGTEAGLLTGTEAGLLTGTDAGLLTGFDAGLEYPRSVAAPAAFALAAGFAAGGETFFEAAFAAVFVSGLAPA